MWKCHAVLATTVPGIALLLWGGVTFNVLIVACGLSLCVAGLAVTYLGVRSPACGARWYWVEMRIQKRDWARRLFSQTECPACRYKGGPDDD